MKILFTLAVMSAFNIVLPAPPIPIPLLPNYVKNGGVFTLSGNLTSSSQALGILFGEDDPHCEDFCLLANFPNGGGPYITFTAKDATWVAHYNGEILEAKLGFALEIGFVNFESMGKHSFPSINAQVVPGVKTLELSTDDHWADSWTANEAKLIQTQFGPAIVYTYDSHPNNSTSFDVYAPNG